MAKNRSKTPSREWPAQVTDPAASTPPCEPGSIEQQLDMCETGPVRGDEIAHQHGILPEDDEFVDLEGVDKKMGRMRMDMSEPSREGDEMSGDEHSAGLQGGEPELQNQPHIDDDLPGEETQKRELLEQHHFQSDEDNVVILFPKDNSQKKKRG